MVLIYIFNVPVVLANVEDANPEDVVITIEPVVQESTLELEVIEPDFQEEEVVQSPSQSQLNDLVIIEEEVNTTAELDGISTQDSDLTIDRLETQITEQEIYTTQAVDSDQNIPVDSNLQQQDTQNQMEPENSILSPLDDQNSPSDNPEFEENLDSSPAENFENESVQENYLQSDLSNIQDNSIAEDNLFIEDQTIKSINEIEQQEDFESNLIEDDLDPIYEETTSILDSIGVQGDPIDQSDYNSAFDASFELQEQSPIDFIEQVDASQSQESDSTQESVSTLESIDSDLPQEFDSSLDSDEEQIPVDESQTPLLENTNLESSTQDSISNSSIESTSDSNPVLDNTSSSIESQKTFYNSPLESSDDFQDEQNIDASPIDFTDLTQVFDVQESSPSSNQDDNLPNTSSNIDLKQTISEEQVVRKPESKQSENLEKSQKGTETTTDQKKYTIDSPLLKEDKDSLDTQENFTKKSTTQIAEVLKKNKAYIEFKAKDKLKSSSSRYSKLGSLEQREFVNQVFESTLSEFHVLEKQKKIQTLKNLPKSVLKKSISNQETSKVHSLALSSDYQIQDVNLIAFESHEINLDSPSENALSSTDQKQNSPLNGPVNLDLLDKVHPSKVSDDLNLNGCADLIENNTQFNRFCNVLDDKSLTQKSILSLNLKSTKNVFNTQKVVLNGVSIPDSKVELHLLSADSDKILSVIQSDKNGNFIYLLDSNLVEPNARFYLKDEFSNVSQNYEYAFDFSKQKNSPKVLKLCGQNYHQDQTVLCNPKEGFDIKLKSEYQTLTKAYFNSVVHTATAATNNTQDIAILNPDSAIQNDLKSGDIHRVIIQNFDPLNPDILSEPLEIFYKVHYPIINPVLLPLFVLLFLLAVVILYDYLIYSYQNLNSKLIYESYKVFKNSDINPSIN